MREYEEFKGAEIIRSVTVGRPVGAVYRFWRNPENLPKIMSGLEKVTILDDKLSHWVLKGPLGMRIEWDSELTADLPEALIGWRSVGKAAIRSIGRVEFASTGPKPSSSPAGEQTQVTVSMKFAFRGGRLGSAIARFFGDDPSGEVAACLLEFKHLMEAGQNDNMGAQYSDVA